MRRRGSGSRRVQRRVLTAKTRLLGFEGIANLMGQFISFGGGVLIGILIIGVGLYLAQLTRDLVRSSLGRGGGD